MHTESAQDGVLLPCATDGMHLPLLAWRMVWCLALLA